jgi:hypothetical protein
MPASHFAVKPMTGRPKFIVRHSTIAGKKVGHHQISVNFEKFDVVQALLSFF